MAMTIQEFNALPLADRWELLDSEGIYLELNRLTAAHTVALFHIYGFYAEVWLHNLQDRLTKAYAFDSSRKLDPYLALIDLDELY